MAGKSSRKPLMAGNWKMNLNHFEAIRLVQDLAFRLDDKDFEAVDVVVLPPFTDIRSVQTLIDADHLTLSYGAQDVSPHEAGAFTGDVSAAMLAKLGCEYVVVGHSERRQYHEEGDALVAAKASAALQHQLTPIVCVGESLEVRQAGEHVAHVLSQLEGSLEGIADLTKVVIAYEPVWAIGTGEVATPDDAQEVCGAIRAALKDRSAEAGADVRILYGGSVKPDNVVGIMEQPDIDGALVGGGSLSAIDFVGIVRFSNQAAENAASNG